MDERPASRAQRPASRAQSVSMQRPMTSGRPMSSAARPGTASRRAPPTALGRPGTASRLAQQMQAGIAVQTARPGTRGGVVPATALGRVDRPLSQYGLPTTAVGRVGTAAGHHQQRVVQDRTYWANMIKARLQALRTEHDVVQNDLQQMHADADTLPLYQQDAEKTALELNNLRGELNDYSRILEMTLNADDIDKMRRSTETLRANNARLQRQLDELYSERKSRQTEVTQWRMRLEELNSKEASLVGRMNDEQRATYEKFKQANNDILHDLSARQTELDKLKQRRQAVLTQIHEQNNNDDRITAVGVLENLFDLSDKIKVEEDEIADTETVEQKQNKLQFMVTSQTEEIDTLQKQIKSYERQLEQTREALQELEANDLSNFDSKKQDRFRQLSEKVHEMEDFLQNFDERKDDLQAEAGKRTEQVGTLTKQLGKLQQDVAAYNADFGETDLLDKNAQVGSVASDELFSAAVNNNSNKGAATGDSVEALKAQIEDCRMRLIKISKVDNKLTSSKQGFENDITMMKAEQGKFRNPEVHAAKLRDKTVDLKRQVHALTETMQNLDASLRDNENAVGVTRKENENHPQYSELIRLEHKLQQLGSQQTALDVELNTKRAEMNSDVVKEQVMHQVRTINKALQHYYAQRNYKSHKSTL